MSIYERDLTTGKLKVISGKPTIFTGATDSTDGTAGNVPAPIAGDEDKFLTGGGIWTPDTANLTTTLTSSDDTTETGIIVASGETAMTKLTSGDTHGGLFGLISKSVLNTRKLINTVKMIWSTVASSWAEGETYAVGDVKLWTNGHTYVCKLAHTSSSSITPADTTYWEDKTIGDMISSLNNKIEWEKELIWNGRANSQANLSGINMYRNGKLRFIQSFGSPGNRLTQGQSLLAVKDRPPFNINQVIEGRWTSGEWGSIYMLGFRDDGTLSIQGGNSAYTWCSPRSLSLMYFVD